MNKIKIVTVIIVVAVIIFTAAAAYFMPHIKMNIISRRYTLTKADLSLSGDRIYFLDTGNADAILIESEGKFALVDAAEDSDNPRGFEELSYEGTEDYVIEYVKKIAGNTEGKATLEFVLGTHSHSDHIGGFDSLILDEDITIKTAYLKEYDEKGIIDYEIENWDNKEVYEQMISACKKRGVPIVSDISEAPFTFGNFTFKFCNAEKPKADKATGENENAVGLLIEKNGTRAFLAADINNHIGDEDRLARELGNINLLKVGHHGHNGSTSKNYIKALHPDIAIITSKEGQIKRTPLKNLNKVNAAIYETGKYKGIVAEFTEDGIRLFSDIH